MSARHRARTLCEPTELSPAQHGIWFTEQHQNPGSAYHLALTIDLEGQLHEPALVAACRHLVTNHPALGYAVTQNADQPSLVPAPNPPQLQTLPYHPTLFGEILEQPFDLTSGPLLRLVLTQPAPQRYQLIVVAHHLIFDGLSKEILVEELASAYQRFLGDETADPAEARQFWTQLLGDQPTQLLGAQLTLPGGSGHGPEGASSAITVNCDLNQQASGSLTALAQESGVSRFEWLVTVLGELLRRYGQRQPVLAVDLSTRTQPDQHRIGLYVNELPLPLPDPGDQTCAAAARQVRERLREIYRYRTTPVSRAIPGLRPGTALAQASISFRRRPEGDTSFAGLLTSIDWTPPAAAVRGTLHLQAVDHGDRLRLRLVLDASQVPAEAARRIGTHLSTLLTSSLFDPDLPLRDLQLLPDEEYQHLVMGLNRTDRPYPLSETTLDQLFHQQAMTTPDRLALSCSEHHLTYQQLDHEVDLIAGQLRQAGVGGGDLVAVQLPRSRDLLPTVLAVGRVGAAYLPVDPSYPAARQEMILQDAKPKLVVTAQWLAAAPNFAGAGAVPTGFQPGTTPDDLAYVIYTSGSTGRPKGVQVRRRSLVNLLLGIRDALQSDTLQSDDTMDSSGGNSPRQVWLALTSLGFDIAALELYLPLISGGQVVLVAERDARDGTAINQLIRDAGITHAQATPSGWRMLLESGFGADGSGTQKSVVALIGGEALPMTLARSLRAVTRRLINVYGPTETTIWSTLEEIPEEPTEITIGRPIANTQIYLLDSAGQVVPFGAEGELVIGGQGVALGYLGRAELTAERFVPDPFASATPGADPRMYRTGDRARYLPDGRIEFLGRSDQQIKIRGHRVELGEIETRLLEHPTVAAAAVALRQPQDETADPYLVGYVVTPADRFDPTLLREHLGTVLPRATVPTAWVRLDQLPLTPNGKLDRAALPAPETPLASQPEPQPADTRATDPITEQIRTIWQEVLGIPSIADDEDLFDLGGHSLTITRISARIAKRLRVNLPLDLFYDTPTIAEIADAVRAGKEN